MKTGLLRHITRLTAVLIIAVVAAVSAHAATTWERVAPASQELVESLSDNTDIRVDDRTIYITLGEKAEVKVFTILGQLVAQQQVSPGVWRMPVKARGIYIIKIGSTARRVTI